MSAKLKKLNRNPVLQMSSISKKELLERQRLHLEGLLIPEFRPWLTSGQEFLAARQLNKRLERLFLGIGM